MSKDVILVTGASSGFDRLRAEMLHRVGLSDLLKPAQQ